MQNCPGRLDANMAPRSSQEEAPEEEEEAPGHDEFVADLSKFAEDRR